MLSSNDPITHYKFSDLSLDVQRVELTRQGETIALPKLSYDLLVALVEAAPALLSQAELMTIVWPDRVIGDETLKQRVKLLRKSLGDDANEPLYIEAIRGQGYRLIPEVKAECYLKQAPSVMIDLSANDIFPNMLFKTFSPLWIRLSVAVFSICFIALITLSASQLYYGQKNDLETTSITKVDSNIGTQAHKLYMQGKNYYQRYRQRDNDIAIDFFVKAIVADSTYSKAYAGLSQAYSQKRYQFSGNKADLQAAIENAYLAISFDSHSAESYKALGAAYYVSGWLFKSIDAFLKAYHLDPKNKETLTSLAFIHSEQGRYPQALNWHKKALNVAPDYALAMVHYGLTLQRVGHDLLASSWLEKALVQKPDYVMARIHFARLLIKQQKYAQAKALLEQALQQNSKHQQLLTVMAELSYVQHDIENAQLYYAKASEQAQWVSSARIMSLLLKQNTSTESVLTLIDQLKALQLQGNEKPFIALGLAKAYEKLGNIQQAVRYFVQAVEQGLSIDHNVVLSPYLKAVRNDPTYLVLMDKQDKKLQLIESEN